MFIWVAIILVLCTTICKGIQCDPAKDYLVQNKTSGEILRCLDCRVCKAGLEPELPCGTVIGIEDSIGDCQPCKDGYHSAEEDILPCQICQSSKCSDHELVKGTCMIDKPDTSHCTGQCKEGYTMNSNGTVCEANKLQQITTKNPVQSNKTDGEPLLSIAEIILIIIGSLIIIALPFVGLCTWHFIYRRYRSNARARDTLRDKEKNDLANTIATSLSETKDKVTGKVIQQEECQQNDLLTSDGPHVMETTGGYVNSSQRSNVPNDVSDISMDQLYSTSK